MRVSVRRYVEWRINICPDYYEAIRYDQGDVILIGRSTSNRDVERCIETDRIRVLGSDPHAFEVRAMEYHCRCE